LMLFWVVKLLSSQRLDVPTNEEFIVSYLWLDQTTSRLRKKCEVFGVCCEGTGKQVFYLANEGESPGKGANTVVSYVHY
ncbi:hypothetical protein DPMN_178687, partial [Dreissena polymorpha]